MFICFIYSKRKKYTKLLLPRIVFCTSVQAKCEVPMNATKAVQRRRRRRRGGVGGN
jgi:hypothetical protein